MLGCGLVAGMEKPRPRFSLLSFCFGVVFSPLNHLFVSFMWLEVLIRTVS